MPAEPRTVIVTDSLDNGGLSAALGRRIGPGHSVIVAQPAPRITKPWQLAVDVVMALGKRFDALDREDRVTQAWPLVRVWLRAERIQHLVILDAERLPPGLWTGLGNLAADAGMALWLVTPNNVDSAHLRALAALSRSRPSDMLRALPIAAPSPPEIAEQSQRIRHIVTPATACALALAADGSLTMEQVSRLNMDNVESDRWLRIDGRTHGIPHHCRGAVRAQLLCRTSVGAHGTNPFFIDVHGSRPNADHLYGWIAEATGRAALPERMWHPRLKGPGLVPTATSPHRLADIGLSTGYIEGLQYPPGRRRPQTTGRRLTEAESSLERAATLKKVERLLERNRRWTTMA